MKTKEAEDRAVSFDPKIMDELLAGKSSPGAIQGLIEEFTKAVLERALAGELTHHLGYETHAKQKTGNSRNGHSSKTLKTKQGELEIAIPRDRHERAHGVDRLGCIRRRPAVRVERRADHGGVGAETLARANCAGPWVDRDDIAGG